ncbi:MAG: glucose-1-phosphate cytidylyltransferase [Nitrososphaera sp.]
MKVVILAGGLGTRLLEETRFKPKPLVEIGNMPIIWHIMKIYSAHGLNNFIICCGYKGNLIKEYFTNYYLQKSDITIDTSENRIEINKKNVEPWKITLVDTGLDTMTGGRLKRVREYLDGPFCFTYGDTLNDVNILNLINFHKKQKKLVTVTACQPPGKFGILEIKSNIVTKFKEKPMGDGNWVNGGFFVLEPEVIEYIKNDSTVWEHEPMDRLVKEGQIAAYKHTGFYQPIDTLREKQYLQELWDSGRAYWKVWQ